ncbi:MAG: hypothetical protein R2778_15305 [Saprospiraceae bacterium]
MFSNIVLADEINRNSA